MTMNKNTELSAETMAFIDTICENSDTVSLSVSDRGHKKRDPSIWTSPGKFVVLGDQT